MSDRMKSLADSLGPLVANLEQRARDHLNLTEKVRVALDGDEKEHVISASYRGDTLIVVADSAAWCPQIRYAQAVLLERLRAAGETQFTKIKVKVGARIAE